MGHVFGRFIGLRGGMRMLANTGQKQPGTPKIYGRWAQVLRLDWLGQMAASLLWVVSVFIYGISSLGDVLQLCAALAWMLANLYALFRVPIEDE